jgi:hypothetical protein
MTSNEQFELQSYRFRRNLQILYKVYLHPSSYKKVTIFENRQTLTWGTTVAGATVLRRGYCSHRCGPWWLDTVSLPTAVTMTLSTAVAT